ncbi:MAG: hypothetical protein ABWW69_01285 [Pyrodictiaceae archaeon]
MPSRLDSLLILTSSVTGVLLTPLAYLSFMSGFCIRSPELLSLITLGLLGSLDICSLLHVIVLPWLLTIIGGIHGVSTSIILLMRIRHQRAGVILGYLYLVFVLILLSQVILALILSSMV